MRLEQALQRYLLQLEADGRSIHTRHQYARHLRLLASWFGDDRDLEAIEPTDLAQFLTSPMAKLSARGGDKRATSLNSLRTSLRVFFNYHHSAGLVSRNAARQVRRAICGSPPPRALSDDEVQRLLDVLMAAQGAAARRDHMLIALMLATGVRLGSALGLVRRDVDLERGEIQLRTVKGDRPEVVYFGRAIREHLVGFLADRPDGPLFTRPDGQRIGARQVQRRIEQSMRAAGIRMGTSAHSLRHTFGTRLYGRTHDVLLVQRAMTHRSIASTLVYARTDDQRLREALGA